jgi:hypothetical protein
MVSTRKFVHTIELAVEDTSAVILFHVEFVDGSVTVIRDSMRVRRPRGQRNGLCQLPGPTGLGCWLRQLVVRRLFRGAGAD